jgi:alkanesulfonate monooxygenase SsuD/methylene tetrahydromethanopterin reductase-like flavin-dependent oxidoreductase (luciferase family)
MTPSHRFRLGAHLRAGELARTWGARARQAEELGYATVLVPDHLGGGGSGSCPSRRERPTWSGSTSHSTRDGSTARLAATSRPMPGLPGGAARLPATRTAFAPVVQRLSTS